MKNLIAITLCLVVSSVFAKPPPDTDQGVMQKLVTPPFVMAGGASSTMQLLNISGEDLEVTGAVYNGAGELVGTEEAIILRGAIVENIISLASDPNDPSGGHEIVYWVVTWFGKPDDLIVTNCAAECYVTR